MDVVSEQFCHLQADRIEQIRYEFGRYIKDLDRLRETLAPSGAPGTIVTSAPIVQEVTPDGFPVVPNISFEQLKKKELEDLMRNYLNKHYRMSLMPPLTPVPDISTELACGRNHVPMNALATNTTDFVSAEYLPNAITICDPRNMRKEDIQSFFGHIKQRQDQYGAENAFRFRKALGRDQEHLEINYPDPVPLHHDHGQQSPRKLPKKRGKGKAKGPTLTPGTMPSGISAPDTPAPNTPAPDTPAPDTPAPDTPAPGTSAPHISAPGTSAQPSTPAEFDVPMTIIGQAAMMTLVAKGHPPVLPLNGPNDGDPQYAVPVLALPLPSNDAEQPNVPIDPALLLNMHGT